MLPVKALRGNKRSSYTLPFYVPDSAAIAVSKSQEKDMNKKSKNLNKPVKEKTKKKQVKKNDKKTSKATIRDNLSHVQQVGLNLGTFDPCDLNKVPIKDLGTDNRIKLIAHIKSYVESKIYEKREAGIDLNSWRSANEEPDSACSKHSSMQVTSEGKSTEIVIGG